MPDTTRQRLMDLLTRARPILYLSRQSGAQQLVADIDDQLARAPGRALSSKQADILRLLGEGKTTVQISAALGVGLATVDRARKRAKERAEIRSTAEVK